MHLQFQEAVSSVNLTFILLADALLMWVWVFSGVIVSYMLRLQ